MSGWGYAGRGRIREAVGLACRSAARDEKDFDAVFGSGMENLWTGKTVLDPAPAIGDAPAFAAALAFVAAIQWLRAGKSETVLVADARGRSMTIAIILTRRGNQDG